LSSSFLLATCGRKERERGEGCVSFIGGGRRGIKNGESPFHTKKRRRVILTPPGRREEGRREGKSTMKTRVSLL